MNGLSGCPQGVSDSREHANEPTLEQGTPMKEFVNDWLLRHEVALTNALGMDDGPEI